MSTLNLTGNYNFSAQRIAGLSTGTIIDAHLASFTQDNWAGDGGANNPYPFQVVQTSGAVIIGGTINGQIDQRSDWRTVYDHGNSAGVRIEDAPNATIRDWRITNTWDAIRVSWNSPNFIIEDCWVTHARDDAVENDRLQTGTIRDSLFDGVFGGISIDPSSASPVDGHNETVTLDGVLMRLEPSLYLGEMTHSAFIKTDSATNGTVTPNLRFINNVIAIEDVTHHSYRSLRDAWANTVQSSGNYYLNLSDTPLPSDYPMPPAGWTVLQGQAARDYWESARTAWVDRHSGADVPFSGTTFTGNDTSETITGNALNNVINAQGGNDTVNGGAGLDTISGGKGLDTIFGGAGNDTIYGGTSTGDPLDAADTIYGQGGNDTIYGNAGYDLIFGGEGLDTIYGGGGNDTICGGIATGDPLDAADTIYGNGGNDTIYGNGGNDVIFGGGGLDTIYGGAGADRFVFSDALNAATNVDAIMSFVINSDDIVLSQAIFSGIGASLDAAEFQIGVANSSSDRIIYNQATGQLFFDADGLGGAAQTLFATVTAGTALTINDFIMIA